MPHSPEEKKKVLARVRRIRGQCDALDRALEAGADCGPVLQQIAAIRGAVNGLMSEVMEAHLRARDWLEADRVTLADIASYSYIAHAPEGGVGLSAYPAIRAWLARVEALEGFVGMARSPALA